MGNDLNLALTSLADDDVVTEVADTAVDLDLVLEELLEGSGVEDLVASGLLGVDDELGADGMLATHVPPPPPGGARARARGAQMGEMYLLGGLALLALGAGGLALLKSTLAYCFTPWSRGGDWANSKALSFILYILSGEPLCRVCGFGGRKEVKSYVERAVMLKGDGFAAGRLKKKFAMDFTGTVLVYRGKTSGPGLSVWVGAGHLNGPEALPRNSRSAKQINQGVLRLSSESPRKVGLE